jgi:hypothetical protein
MLCCSVVGTIVEGPAASYFDLILVHFKTGSRFSEMLVLVYQTLQCNQNSSLLSYVYDGHTLFVCICTALCEENGKISIC